MPSTSAIAAPDRRPPRTSQRRPKVLIVDDSAVARAVIARALGEAGGFELAGAVPHAAAALALLAASGLAAAAGTLIGPRLTPEARLLMLALALLLQGGGALGRVKPPERLDGWRIGAFPTALLGLFVLAFGDGLQFVVATLAARTPLPWFAAIGGGAGALVVVGVAALLGERDWLALPLRRMRLAVALLFLVAGAVLALAALHLV